MPPTLGLWEEKPLVRRGALRRNLTGWAFLGPYLFFFGLFMGLPLLWGIGVSFHRYALVGGSAFIGLQNYSAALQDPIFWKALGNTFLYVLGLAPLFWLSTFLAVLAEGVRRGRTMYKVILFLPYVVPMVVHGMVFNYIFQPSGGVLNALLGLIGFGDLARRAWLGETGTALPVVTLVWVYVYMGYMVAVLGAGLQDIPREFYESARIDGAGGWTRFTHITLPLLSNVLVFVLVTGIILAFQIFPLVWVMTGYGYGHGAGGPAYSTISLDLYIFASAFRDRNLGYGAAMGVLMLLITVAITALPFRLLPEVRYD